MSAAISRAMPRCDSRSGRFGEHVEIEPRVARRQHVEQRRARRRVGVEREDAVVVLAEPELARRAEHAVRRLAADLALLDRRARRASSCRSRANGYSAPAATLGAPHTTSSSSPLPSSTLVTQRRSEFGMPPGLARRARRRTARGRRAASRCSSTSRRARLSRSRELRRGDVRRMRNERAFSHSCETIIGRTAPGSGRRNRRGARMSGMP